jgi:ABC-type sugar transport system permease subunit
VSAAAPATGGRAGRRRPRGQGGITGRQNVAGWVFALPFVVLFGVFMAGPIVASLLLSLTDFRLRDVESPLGAEFAGLQNYTDILGDERFRKAAFNTAYFVVVGVPLTILLGLLAALALNQGVLRFRALFRVAFYLPTITSIVAIAVVWRFLLNPDLGLINMALDLVGIDGPSWLGNRWLAMPSIIAMASWQGMGFMMIVFLAGLQGIPQQRYEAAHIDGATPFQAFRHVTLPGLRPTILFATVITSIGFLQLFEQPFIMTDGGPLDSTLSVTMLMYEEGFRFFHLGTAAAIGYTLFLVIAVLAFVQFRVLEER